MKDSTSKKTPSVELTREACAYVDTQVQRAKLMCSALYWTAEAMRDAYVAGAMAAKKEK